jgi:hypothetical protein
MIAWQAIKLNAMLAQSFVKFLQANLVRAIDMPTKKVFYCALIQF